MAEDRRFSLHVPWATLLKILVALSLIWIWRELVWFAMLLLIAIVIAVGLDPAVRWLERRRWPRPLAASTCVLIVVGAIVAFLALTWTTLAAQSSQLGSHIAAMERELETRAPAGVVDILKPSGNNADASVLAPYVMSFGRSVLWAATAFVLAWILVVYLLIESNLTYRWVRGFVPAPHRARFDRTAAEARDAAFGYVVGNVITSIFAGMYVFAWMTVLGVPAALLLAVLAFVCDFIPVLGFFLACIPAVVMAATVSPLLALAMAPLYLAYHFIENYFVAPRVYGSRLQLSNVAVLIAFAVGAELGGVAGALLALPLAAVYPAIERIWLREPFGDDVVREHDRLRVKGA